MKKIRRRSFYNNKKIFLSIILLFIILVIIVRADWTNNLNTKLIGYYNFSDGNNSVIGQEGLYFNTTANYVSSGALLGKAVIFDDDGDRSRINVTSSLFNFGYPSFPNVTFNFWINETVDTGSETPIVSRYSSNAGGQGWIIDHYQHIANNPLDFAFFCSAGSIQIPFPADRYKRWQMITVFVNSTTVVAYNNGTFYDDCPINIEAFTSNEALQLGGTATLGGWRGMIDEMGWWNRSLNDTEILALYNNGIGISFLNNYDIILNKPVDGFISPSQLINFSCSASLLSGSLVNITLWTNRTGTFGIDQVNITTGSSTTANFTNINFTSDGNYKWNCALTDNGGNTVFDADNRTFSISAMSPVLTIFDPNGTYLYAKPGFNMSLNFSAVGAQACWYNYNGINNTIGCGSNSSFIQGSINNLTLYANSSSGVQSLLATSWNFILFENYSSWNYTTSQTFDESFITNITALTGTNISSANLIWNNTRYPGTVTRWANYSYLLSRQISIPTISGNVSWYWSVNVNSTLQINFSTNTQTVGTITIDDCSANTLQIYNFTLWDEDTRTTYLNGTIELVVNFFNQERSLPAGSFNKSYTVINGNPAKVCISNINSTYSTDYQAKYYSNSSYVVEYKYGQNILISNSTSVNNIALYDLLDFRSTTFTITLQSPDLTNIAGAVIDVQRQYVPVNQFISVESPLTDSTGVTQTHLVAKEIYYNFVVTKNNTLLGSFNNYLVQCQNEVTGECRITLNLAQSSLRLGDYTDYGNVSINFDWNPDDRTLDLNYLSTDGNNHLVYWNVSKFDNYNNNTICTGFDIGTSGTLTCNAPTSIGNSSIITYTYIDGNFIGYNTFSLASSSVDIFGGTRVVLGLLMYSTLTLLLISNPVMMIIGSFMGIIFVVAFHLADGGSFIGNTSIILWFFIAGAILIYYMRRSV